MQTHGTEHIEKCKKYMIRKTKITSYTVDSGFRNTNVCIVFLYSIASNGLLTFIISEYM